MPLADQLKRHRDEQHLTQKQLHQRCGVSVLTISRIETGTYDPTRVKVGTLLRLARGLAVTPNDLLDEVQPVMDDVQA